MIAEWMLYSMLATLGLSVAAVLAERALLAGRGPVRMVWIGAVALSLLVPVLAFQFSAEPTASVVPTTLAGDQSIATIADVSNAPAIEHTVPVAPPSNAGNWRATLDHYDQPLLIVWATLSVALALNFLGGVITLAWMRRTWQQQTLQNIPVLISQRTGPAVVGAISPAIVLPEWVLRLEPTQLALMLRHEDEHRRARDGQLLTVARLALIVMPWNAALWWQILRLRVAVEFDCDARVLQNADARSYGDLLLEVASARRGPSLIGATAFAERATQLERRIRVLPRHRVSTSRASRAIALSVSVAAVTVAWAAPHPAIPARTPATTNAPEAKSVASAVPLAAQPASTEQPGPNKPVSSRDAETTKPASIKPQRSAITRDTTVKSASARISGDVRVGGSTISGDIRVDRATASATDSLFKLLYDGITLTRRQETAARTLIDDVQKQQAAAVAQFVQKRIELQARRDSTLRALLASDADRAALNARITPVQLPGARGQSNGQPPQTQTPVSTQLAELGGRGGGGGGRGGRGGGDGGGRGGGRAGRGSSPEAIGASADATFHRLFDGITLTAEQEAVARTAIFSTLNETLTQQPPGPAPIRVNSFTGMITVRTPIDSSLLSFVSSVADRAKLEARITRGPL